MDRLHLERHHELEARDSQVGGLKEAIREVEADRDKAKLQLNRYSRCSDVSIISDAAVSQCKGPKTS